MNSRYGVPGLRVPSRLRRTRHRHCHTPIVSPLIGRAQAAEVSRANLRRSSWRYAPHERYRDCRTRSGIDRRHAHCAVGKHRVPFLLNVDDSPDRTRTEHAEPRWRGLMIGNARDTPCLRLGYTAGCLVERRSDAQTVGVQQHRK